MKFSLLRVFFLIGVLGFGWGTCSTAKAAEDFAKSIEKAQRADLWRAKAAVQAEMTIRFGGKDRFVGRILMRPQADVVRLERADGAVLVFDGVEGWMTPTTAEWPRARFDVLTWAYFWAVPYKLRDRGVKLEVLGQADLRGKAADTARLTFAPGTGDAPDDWYLLYRDPEAGRLAAMAYIVTFTENREQAEKAPHAILYEDFQEVDGIPVPMRWTFWNWSKEKGIHGEAIGEVTLRNVSFPSSAAAMFAKPEGAAPVPRR